MYAALLDALNIPQAAFYAISQGGASSLEFAQAHPERCLGLMFVSAFTRPPHSGEFRTVLPYLKALMSLDFVMWLLKPILVSGLISQARKALPSADLQDVGNMAALRDFFGTISQASLRGQGLVNDFNNLYEWTGISLSQLTVPVLLFHGTTDVFVRCEDSVVTAKDIPDARYVQLDGVGHEGGVVPDRGGIAVVRHPGQRDAGEFEGLADGAFGKGDLELLEELSDFMQAASLCALGQSAPNPVASTLKYFRDEYEEHIRHKRCRAGVCSALIAYDIDQEKCEACGSCQRSCPVGAVNQSETKVFTIVQDKCIKCGACFRACPEKFSAVIKVPAYEVQQSPVAVNA